MAHLHHRRGMDAPSWLLAGQDGIVEFLTHCPRRAAETYASTHTVNLPAYMELASPPASIAVASLSGNPLAEPASMDAEMSANVDSAPLMMEQESDHSMGTTATITPATAAPALGMDTAEAAPE